MKANESVCSYHVKYTSESESRLCSSLNFKEYLARSRRDIRSLSDCNWTRTHNHLVHNRTLNHLAKVVIFFLNCWVFDYELSGCGFKSSCNHLKQIWFANKRRTSTWKVMLSKRRFLFPIYNLVRWWQNINRRYTVWCIFFISWSRSTNKRTNRFIRIFSLMYRSYIDTLT